MMSAKFGDDSSSIVNYRLTGRIWSYTKQKNRDFEV